MSNRLKNKSGFTLIELVMVIVILAILAIVAVPKFFDLSTDSKAASEKGVVGGVRAGIGTYFAQNKAFPADLDAAAAGACASGNVCFNNVLGQGGVVSSDWTRGAGATYTGPTGATYTYTAATGSF